MDYAAEVREEALHLIAMADQPAFRGQAALRLKELVASSEIYAALPQVIEQERARMRAETSNA